MNSDNDGHRSISRLAAAIGDPSRARMLCCLLDGHARTSTELAIVGEVSPSTASAHLGRLVEHRLVSMAPQGKHRYYRLAGPAVARVLEALSAAAGPSRSEFVPGTPAHLRLARRCYDHMAGHAAVLLRDRFERLRWLCASAKADDEYQVTLAGLYGEYTGEAYSGNRILWRRFRAES